MGPIDPAAPGLYAYTRRVRQEDGGCRQIQPGSTWYGGPHGPERENPDPADYRNRACLQFRGRGFGSLRLGVRAALPRRFTSNQAAVGPRRQCTQQETTQIATVLLWWWRLRPLPPEAAAPARHARASGLPQVVLCCRGPTHALGSAPLPLACNLGSGGQVAETGSQDPIRHAEAVQFVMLRLDAPVWDRPSL